MCTREFWERDKIISEIYCRKKEVVDVNTTPSCSCTLELLVLRGYAAKQKPWILETGVWVRLGCVVLSASSRRKVSKTHTFQAVEALSYFKF
jgi:hypothetical protein